MHASRFNCSVTAVLEYIGLGSHLQKESVQWSSDGWCWYFAMQLLPWANIMIIMIITAVMKNAKDVMNCYFKQQD